MGLGFRGLGLRALSGLGFQGRKAQESIRVNKGYLYRASLRGNEKSVI